MTEGEKLRGDHTYKLIVMELELCFSNCVDSYFVDIQKKKSALHFNTWIKTFVRVCVEYCMQVMIKMETLGEGGLFVLFLACFFKMTHVTLTEGNNLGGHNMVNNSMIITKIIKIWHNQSSRCKCWQLSKRN